MADRTSWRLPIGPMNWIAFAAALLVCLVCAFLLVVMPVGSKDWWSVFGGAVLGGLCLLAGLWRPTRRKEQVTFDDEQVVRTMSNGRVESVRWSDLRQVSIMTTSDGPGADDVFFMLFGEGKAGCAVPQSAEGMDRLLARLQQLPGFDNEAVIRAMGSTSEADFPCWKRPNTGG